MAKTVKQMILEEQKKQNKIRHEFYNLRPLLGHFNWAMLACLLGGRETGKSYSVTNYFVDSFVKKGIPFYWLRLTDKQTEKLLQNNAEMLVDPDIRRKYNLTLKTRGNNVYSIKYKTEIKKQKDGSEKEVQVETERKLMARVFALSNFYNQKGSGLFDKDFLKDVTMQYHIALDEFEKEENEKSQGDILYQFVNQIENLIRSSKERVKIFIIGNMLDTCADIMAGLNFIPDDFGIYKLKSKRTVIDYMMPTDAYKERRRGSFADIMMPSASTFTNKIIIDKTKLSKRRLIKLQAIIKFTKDTNNWFTLWDDGVIAKYKNNKTKIIYAMRPYLDEVFTTEARNAIITNFDARCYKFNNLLTFKEFQKNIELLRPSR